jgi:hypothetical protein
MAIHDITSFKIHQFKGVRATVEIHPNGPGLVVIGGGNGSGKSSVVDGIMQLVSPSGVAGIPKPIHEGKDSAYVEMTTSLATVRRDYPKDGAGTMKATAIDGAKYGSGKEFMLKSTGGQVFDTAQFAMLAEKDQRADLLRRVDLPFDVDELDAKRKGYFYGRTDVTREVKMLTAQLAGFAPHDDSLPDAEVSVSELMAKHTTASEHNRARAAAADKAEQQFAAVERAEAALAAAKAALASVQGDSIKAKAAADQFSPEVDLTTLTAEMEGIDATNAKVRAQLARTGVAAELELSTDSENALTADIKAIDKTKADGLAAATFPVKGLGIDATGITFDGIPFRQVNPAQQIIVAFDLFTVDKPDLRIIFIKNGDLLDNTSLAGIEKLAIERGYYVIVERDRDNSGALGWTMKDGALAVQA